MKKEGIERLRYLIKDNLKDNNHKETILEQFDLLVKNKKYTEEDVRKAIWVGIDAEVGSYPKGFDYKLGIKLDDYYIQLLNKDNGDKGR